MMNLPKHLNASPTLAAVVLALAGTLARSALQQPTPSAGGAYARWVSEDVAYIIQDSERAAFRKLGSDAERDRFIEQFWERRNPVPGSAKNDFREEHYRRIAYANRRFAGKAVDGWKTDRGRIYITYGPPDEIDSHPSEFRESWRYRLIAGIGTNVTIDFEDRNRDGSYPMTRDPNH